MEKHEGEQDAFIAFLTLVLIVLLVIHFVFFAKPNNDEYVTADVIAENYMVDGFWQDIDLGHGKSTELDPMNDVSSNLQVVYSYHGKRYRVNSSHYEIDSVEHKEQIKIKKSDIGRKKAKITLYAN